MDYNALIACLVACAFLVFVVTLIVGVNIAEKHRKKLLGISISSITVLLIAAIVFLILGHNNSVDKWNYVVANEWSFYCNGAAIDPNNVSMDQYRIEFDDVNHKVIMTSKR